MPRVARIVACLSRAAALLLLRERDDADAAAAASAPPAVATRSARMFDALTRDMRNTEYESTTRAARQRRERRMRDIGHTSFV